MWVCNRLALILRMKRLVKGPSSSSIFLEKIITIEKETLNIKESEEKQRQESSNVIKPTNSFYHSDSQVVNRSNKPSVKLAEENEIIAKQAENIENILKETQRHQEMDELIEDEELKFKFAALVMDRFFFCLSLAYFIVVFCALVLAVPNFYKFQ